MDRRSHARQRTKQVARATPRFNRSRHCGSLRPLARCPTRAGAKRAEIRCTDRDEDEWHRRRCEAALQRKRDRVPADEDDAATTVEVYLCPKSFLEDMGVSFAKGDPISLSGSKVKQGEADLILAREVVKKGDTLVLRDGKGKPVWN